MATNANTNTGSAATPAIIGYDLSSEQNLISGALQPALDGAIQTCLASVVHSDFVHPQHALVWQHKANLMNSSLACDFAAIMGAAARTGDPLDVAYLTALAQSPLYSGLSSKSLAAAAQRVHGGAARRKLAEIAQIVTSQAAAEFIETSDLMRLMEDGVIEVRKSSERASSGPRELGFAVIAAIEQIEARSKSQSTVTGIPTGSNALDKMLGGFQNGDLIILAARPSMGKTASMMHKARAAARHTRQGKKCRVLIFSTEQKDVALATRELAATSRVSADALRSGRLTDSDWGRLIDASQDLTNTTIEIDDTTPITLPEMRARARAFRQKYIEDDLIVFVDYLQRISSHDDGPVDLKNLTSTVSSGLKDLARELNCPVVALAQLNRGLEQRANKRPLMSDLAESGKIEADADVIIFLYRDEYYNPDSKEPGIIEEIIAKQRDGAVGTTKMAFLKPIMRFEEIEHTSY